MLLHTVRYLRGWKKIKDKRRGQLTQDLVVSLGWDIVTRPSYSQDLAPSDYHIFNELKLCFWVFGWTTIFKWRGGPRSCWKVVSEGGAEGIRRGYTKASPQASKTHWPRRRLFREIMTCFDIYLVNFI